MSNNSKPKKLTPANLKKLLEQQERLKVQIRDIKRSNENRTKVLYGVALLKAMESGKFPEATVRQLLNLFITRPSDREFLGLPVRETTSTNGNGTHANGSSGTNGSNGTGDNHDLNVGNSQQHQHH